MSPSGPRRDNPKAHAQKDRTPDVLMGVAKRLFAQHGFDGTSVKMIAEAAKVNVSLVSYHFSGKEGLFRACVEGLGRERLEVAQRVLKTPTNADEFKVRLGIFIDEMLLFMNSESEVITLIHRRIESGEEKSLKLFRDTFLRVFDTLVGFFDEARRAGILREDTNTIIVAQTLIGALTHFQRADLVNRKIHNVTIENEKFRKQLSREIINLMMNGVAVRDSKI